MFKKSLLSLAVASSIALTGCLDSGGSSNNANPEYTIENPAIDGKTWPIFNPVTRALPIPNDLQFQQNVRNTDGELLIKSDGTFSDPLAKEPNAVEIALGYMDGASTVAPMDISFNGSINPESVNATQFLADGKTPNPEQNVFLLELTYPGGDPLQSASIYVRKDANVLDGITADELTPDQSQARVDANNNLQTKSIEVPTFAAAMTQRYVSFSAEVISLDGGLNNTLRISPEEPLKPETRYLVIVTDSIQDAAGNAIIADPLYANVADPSTALGTPNLIPARDVIMGWQTLAEGWFNNATNKARQAFNAPSLTKSNIALSYTFTTGGTDTVLKSMAAPATFFKKSAETSAKQDAIKKLVLGVYNLNGVNQGLQESVDIATNSTLKVLLTTKAFPDGSANPLYSEAIAGAIAQADSQGVALPYSALASNPTAAIALQLAAAEAAIQARGANTINGTAKGTAAALNAGLAEFQKSLPTPKPRNVAFYSSSSASALNPQLSNPGTIHLGKIELPYYLPVPTASDESGLAGTWRADHFIGAAIDGARQNAAGTTPPTDKVTYRFPFAEQQATVTAPLLIHTPNSKPASGKWPVVIYQHGIFGDRSHALPLANQIGAACLNPSAPLGTQCFATIAIDLPLHGVAPKLATGETNSSLGLSVDVGPTADAIKKSPLFESLSERHFGWGKNQAQENVRISYGENSAGSSGQHFINLSTIPASRDNGRQAVMDLLNLNATLGQIDVDSDGTPDFDTTRVYFVGHSLGGIVGTTFVAVNNDPQVQSQGGTPIDVGNANLSRIQAAALVTSGGGVARLLENSPNIGSTVLAGLADKGVTQGSSGFEKFMTVAQGTVDSFDAINFARKAGETTPVYLNEIYGDGSDRATRDNTIPVAADPKFAGPYTAPLGQALRAPLSGTEPLIAQVRATQVSSDTMPLPSNDVVVRFTAGSHTTIVRPTTETEMAVFADMVTNMVSFFSSNGQALTFNNAAAVKQSEPSHSNP